MWIVLDLALTCSCRSSLVAQQVSFWENETIDHRPRSPDPGEKPCLYPRWAAAL
jgi:hypothetical protein